MLSHFIFSMTTMYGVVNVTSTPSTDDFTCETNLSYDVVKNAAHSTVPQPSPVPLYESVQ